jgi:hypothetical protein
LMIKQCRTDTTSTGAAGTFGGGTPPRIGVRAFGFKDGTRNDGEVATVAVGVLTGITGTAAGKLDWRPG